MLRIAPQDDIAPLVALRQAQGDNGGLLGGWFAVFGAVGGLGPVDVVVGEFGAEFDGVGIGEDVDDMEVDCLGSIFIRPWVGPGIS